MKWLAASIAVLAVILRLTWHSSFAIAIPIGDKTHRGFPLTSVVFWFLVLLCVVLFLISFFRQAHRSGSGNPHRD